MLRHIVIFVMALTLGGCASASDLCGQPPFAPIKPDPGTASDPYTVWRHLKHNSKSYAAAITASDTKAIRGTAWNICRNAVALKPFTGEVAYDERVQFTESLDGVIDAAAQISTTPQSQSATATEQKLLAAINQLERDTPRFWFSPMAKLRGNHQPGRLLPHE